MPQFRSPWISFAWPLAACFGLLCGGGCGSNYKEDFREVVEPEEIASLQQATGLNLSDTASPLGIWIITKPNRITSVKLSLPTEQVDALFETASLKRSDLRKFDEGSEEVSEQSSFPPNRLWWDPGMHTDLEVVSRELPSGDLLHLGLKPAVKPDEPVIVYMTLDQMD